MARLPRLYAPGVAQYVLQRPAAGRRFFDDADDYRFFVALLAEATRRHAVSLHAYVLLPDEVRLLGTPADAGALGRVMQAIGRVYAPYRNRRTGVVGPLWDRRFRSTLIADAHVLTAIRHVERRPAVAGLTMAASEWRWSSLPHHLGERQQAFVTDHPRYWLLSDTPFERQAAYKVLVEAECVDDPETAAGLDRAVEHGWAWDEPASATLTALANRRTTPLARGRKRVRSVPI